MLFGKKSRLRFFPELHGFQHEEQIRYLKVKENKTIKDYSYWFFIFAMGIVTYFMATFILTYSNSLSKYHLILQLIPLGALVGWANRKYYRYLERQHLRNMLGSRLKGIHT